MSFAVPCATSFMIIMQKANLEFRLMQITNTLQNLSRESAYKSAEFLNEYQNNVATLEGQDDEADVAMKVQNNTMFNLKFQDMLNQINAKEKTLEIEKQQLENQLASYNTMEEGVNEMIKSGAKDGFSTFK